MTRTADAPVISFDGPGSRTTSRPAHKVKVEPELPPKPRRPRVSVREAASRTLRDLADRADDQI
ncbi:MAG: hypothetical protein ACRDH9_01160 [Actinomycetota bacterium]